MYVCRWVFVWMCILMWWVWFEEKQGSGHDLKVWFGVGVVSGCVMVHWHGRAGGYEGANSNKYNKLFFSQLI